MTRLIDPYDALLLDMNGTFVFGHDRFAPTAEFRAAYRAAGGLMGERMVRDLLRSYLARMARAIRHPRQCRAIDPMAVVLSSLAPGLAHRSRELTAFETAFAACECGHVPAPHAAALRHLATTHRLGVVSNLWARPDRVEAMLAAAGLDDVFEVCLWSSRLGAAKPALETYDAALQALDLPPERVLFVGADPLGDVHGPKTLGLAALWLAEEDAVYPPDLLPPDARASSLTDLPALTAERLPLA
jgi:putative hydrolase of the HAD superfamily/5'-nucleotidase